MVPDAGGGVAGIWFPIHPASHSRLAYRTRGIDDPALNLRALFWAPTLVSWLAVALLVQTRYETTAQDGKAMLLITGICALVIPAWLAFRTKMFPTWRGLRDACAGLALVAIGAGIFVGAYGAGTRTIAKKAEARWAELGLPLDAFEKSHVPTQENSGSEISRQIFHEYIGQPFYRNGSSAAKREQPILPSHDVENPEAEYVAILWADKTPSDALDFSSFSTASREARSAEFKNACERILKAEPPAWQNNPVDGQGAGVPGYLAFRKFSQLTSAQANRQIEAGDYEGTTRTVTAGQRVYGRLKDSPTFVSLMMRTALDNAFAAVQSRLPANEGGLDALARDAVELRAAFIRARHSDSLFALRRARNLPPEDFARPQTPTYCRPGRNASSNPNFYHGNSTTPPSIMRSTRPFAERRKLSQCLILDSPVTRPWWRETNASRTSAFLTRLCAWKPRSSSASNPNCSGSLVQS